MKKIYSFTPPRSSIFIFGCFLIFLCFPSKNIQAQTDLTCDGTENVIDYNGSYQDYTVPSDATKTHIYFRLRGGDGGKAPVFTSSSGKGGEGAIIEATFPIGEGADSIPSGSTIRFIIGQKGRNRSSGTQNSGTGGGGSAILLQEPDSTNWELLMVAGGGGGGWANTVTSRDGRGGRAGEGGGNGADGDSNGGNGGNNGRGGNSSGNSSGGGGAYDKGGSFLTSDGKGGGRPGWQQVSSDGSPNFSASPEGGDGGCGNEGCSASDGFGFGGGGWSKEEAGGGGGGYSGGGGGGNAAGGGGGGSFVSSMAITNVKNDGGSTSSPNNGKAWYRCVDRPTALCSDYSFSIGTESDVTVSAGTIDNSSSADVGFSLALSPNTFSCDNIGDNTVTLTLTDEVNFTASCTATVTVSDEADAFTNMTDNNAAQMINYSGSFYDLLIPESTTKNALLLELKGGDGGKKRNTSTVPCTGGTGRGGIGATITTLFYVGTGDGEIPPGSIVRFIVGEKGTSVNGTSGIEGAGGGGGTAVLYRESEECDWIILAVAGGGGGGWSDGCYDHSDGQGGRTTTSGGDGKGSSVNVGDGGNNGGGGGSGSFGGVDYSGGGGGASGNGGAINCTGNPDWGDGKRGGTIGGQGGSDGGSCGSGRDGGFGFGGGGLGDGAGGGGGGYSGGGGGSASGGGGGGGSYVSDLSANDFANVLEAGGSTADAEDGYIKYTLLTRSAPVAICNPSTTVSVSHTSTSTIDASTIDNSSYDPEGGDLEYDLSPNTFDCGNLGNQTVTLTVTDNTDLTSSCTAQVTVSYNVNSTTQLNDNGSTHTIGYSGSYTDLRIPFNTEYSRIWLFARGADGGKREIGDCLKKGGQGADAEGLFKIGCGNGEIPPGSIIRFIPGEEGKSTNGAGFEGAGGGGGSGILYKAPGDCTWQILVVAGGGGGAYMDTFCNGNKGKEGTDSTSGSGGSGSNSGGGGSNGNGGRRTFNGAGGGGGAFGNGEEIGCGFGDNWGGGKKGTYAGGAGGKDGSGGCGSGRDGGFGFGGGGLGDASGGGGGGYSGGGAGGGNGGGGGGGSYVNAIAIESDLEERGADGSPNNGNCKYEFRSNTESIIDAAPSAVCKNITVNLDDNGNVVVYPPEVNNGSSDDCGSSYLTFFFSTSETYKSYSCSDAGTTKSVTLTVYDYSGNSDNCSASIYISENTAPEAECQDVTVTLDAMGNGTLAATDVDNGSTDNCSITSRTLSKSSFTTSDVGDQSVTLTVGDGSSNTETCTATVTVEQGIYVTALCQNTTLPLDASGNGSITTSDINNGSSAALGISSITLDQSSFDCSDVGNQTVILTVTDPNNNTSTCSATVDVQDNMAPVVSCQNTTVMLNASGTGATSTNVIATPSDACGIQSVSLSQEVFGCNDVGANTITLTATDNNGNSNTCTSTVSIEDNVAPTAICQPATVQLNSGGSGSLSTTSINNGTNDACGIQSLMLSKTTFECGDVGSNTVTLTATDANNNTSTCSAQVTVEDNIAPVAICQAVTVQLDNSGSGSITTNQVDNNSTDACGIQQLSLDNTTFNCANIGSNTVVLTAMDDNGNTSTCSANITVMDNGAPTASCQPVTIQLNTNGVASLIPQQVDDNSQDACTNVSIGVHPTAFNCANVGGNTVSLTATDGYGNSSNCTTTVTVKDEVTPIAVCQNVTVQLDQNGVGSTSANDIDNNSSDACGIGSLSLNQTAFGCSHVGKVSVTLTVTDVNYNSSTCSADVIVEDNVAPNAQCQDVTVDLDENGLGSTSNGEVNAGSSDACDIDFTSLNETDFSCADLGSNTVTLTVYDANGNSSTCSATAMVEDNILSSIVCKNTTVELDASGMASIVAQAVDGGSSDACSALSFSVDKANFNCSNLGLNPVILTVTDGAGNSETCNALVDVVDYIPPNPVCYNPVIDFNGEAQIPLTVDILWNEAATTDNCVETFFTTMSVTEVTCDQLGSTIPVTLTIEDGSGNTANCTAMVTVDGLPCNWQTTDNGIGCPNGSSADYDTQSGTFSITSQSCYSPAYYRPADSHGYVGTSMCGDGQIIAQVSGISGQAYAGVTMRETLDPSSKMIQMMVNNSGLARRETRVSTGGYAFGHVFQNMGRHWVKLTRIGDQFGAYISDDGLVWDVVLLINIPMENCIEIGLITMNETAGVAATVNFNNVSLSGAAGLGLQGANITDSVYELPSRDFNLYPNPTNGELNVTLDQFMGKKVELEVYNQFGQKVYQKSIDEVHFTSERLNLRHLSGGSYLIKIKAEQSAMAKKFIIAKL